MTGSRHHIRKQTLHVELESEAQALELQPRLSDFNRRRLLAIIEQVFDAVDIPGLHLRIDRLDVDLGTVPLDNFEQVVEERLTARLREVVEQAVHARRVAPPSGEQPRTEAEVRLELFEHYLLHGTLPYWAPGGAGFSFGALFAQVAMSDPQALVRLVGTHASMGDVLDRLVLQLDQRSLERLITLLEPKHAALLIDYIVSLQALHRVKPVVPLSDRGLSRLLWSLTLTYLVKEAGSQFNRKSALKQLLEGVAESQGLEYPELLTTLGIGLEQVRKRHPVLASLSFVIGELVRELPPPVPEAADVEEYDAEELTVPETASARYELTEALRYYLQHGVLPWGTLVRMPELTAERLVATLPELPRSLQRRALAWEHPGGSLTRLVRAVRRIPEETLAKLLVRLMPPSGDEGSPLRSALPVFVARAEDKPLFFARLISALLDGRPVDLEELAAPRAGAFAEARSSPEAELSRWEAHALKSALVSRLRFGEQSGPTVAALLAALLVSFPEDTRHFLLALRDVEVLRTALVEQSEPELIERAMDLLRPREAGTLNALVRALNTLPERLLPRGREGARQEVFHELLLLGETAPLAQGAFSRLLKRLFGSVIPGEVHGVLLRTVMVWEAAGQLPAKQVEAFRGALADVDPAHASTVSHRPSRGNEEAEMFAPSVSSVDAVLTEAASVGLRSTATEEEEHIPPRHVDAVDSEITARDQSRRTHGIDGEQLPSRSVDMAVPQSAASLQTSRTYEIEAEQPAPRLVDTMASPSNLGIETSPTHEVDAELVDAGTSPSSVKRDPARAQEEEAEGFHPRQVDTEVDSPSIGLMPPRIQAANEVRDSARQVVPSIGDLNPSLALEAAPSSVTPSSGLVESSPASRESALAHEAREGVTPSERTNTALVDPTLVRPGQARALETDAALASKATEAANRNEFHPTSLGASPAPGASAEPTSLAKHGSPTEPFSASLWHSLSPAVEEGSGHPKQSGADQVERRPSTDFGSSRSPEANASSAYLERSNAAPAEQPHSMDLRSSRSPEVDAPSTHQEWPDAVPVEQSPSTSLGHSRSPEVNSSSAHSERPNAALTEQQASTGLGHSQQPEVDEVVHPRNANAVLGARSPSTRPGLSLPPEVHEASSHLKPPDIVQAEQPPSAILERSRSPEVADSSAHAGQPDTAEVEQSPSASLRHSRSSEVTDASTHPGQPDTAQAEQPPSASLGYSRSPDAAEASTHPTQPDAAQVEQPSSVSLGRSRSTEATAATAHPIQPDATQSEQSGESLGRSRSPGLAEASIHQRHSDTAPAEQSPSTSPEHSRGAISHAVNTPTEAAHPELQGDRPARTSSREDSLLQQPPTSSAPHPPGSIAEAPRPPVASHDHRALAHESPPTATTASLASPPPRDASTHPGNELSPEPSSDETPAAAQSANLAGHEAREALFSFLLAESADRYAGLSDDALLRLLQSLLDESPEVLRGFVRRHAHRKRLQEHWARSLPDSVLARFSAVLAPHVHAALLSATEVLAAAWQEVAPPGTPALTERSAFWRFVLELLGERPGGSLTLEQLVSAFFEHFSARLHTAQPGHRDSRSTAERLLERAIELARHEAVPRLGALLLQRRAALVTAWTTTTRPDSRRSSTPRSRPSKNPGRTAFRLGEEKHGGTPIYIDNAGLVLASPFLPHLFRELGLSRVDDTGKTHLDPEPATRAVHLLQYLVDGRTSAPEPLLVLNKILCGLSVPTPVPSGIDLTEREQSLCDRLLKALIANWTIIANTSVAGLRETFLQREGRLEQLDDRWKLQVQRKTLDVLVDQVPWSISILTHPWMPQPLYVSW
ncbi:contractile injection system tape measure protein [Myxococcus eversor]|uniref:contractile injection system tape measure protein n=1 Tax=Myxococcus eversor TaxID=2709661 RepID=UPI0013D7A8D3|nr:contractile injection system tape measure protein [Myxococcus eversor]